MALRLTFKEIRPIRLTTPRNNDDEIYFAVAPVGVRTKTSGLEQTPLRGALSRIHTVDDDNPQPYVPKLIKTGNSYVMETGDAERVQIAIALCEEDSGSLYAKLRGDPHFKIPENFKFDWEDVVEVIPGNVNDVKAWVVNAATFLYGLLKGLMADDHIATQTFDVDPKSSNSVDQTLVFKGSGAHYEMDVLVEHVSVHG